MGCKVLTPGDDAPGQLTGRSGGGGSLTASALAGQCDLIRRYATMAC
jgi:hypothetical protein